MTNEDFKILRSNCLKKFESLLEKFIEIHEEEIGKYVISIDNAFHNEEGEILKQNLSPFEVSKYISLLKHINELIVLLETYLTTKKHRVFELKEKIGGLENRYRQMKEISREPFSTQNFYFVDSKNINLGSITSGGNTDLGDKGSI